MESKRGSRLVLYGILTTLFFALHFEEILAQSSSVPDFSRRNLLQTNNESPPISEEDDDTVRADPLNKLEKYRGGYDITNKHYWSSTIFTGIYGYALGLLWLLGGIIYGSFLLVKILCCKGRRKAKLKKKALCYKQCYLRPILLATFLTILAILGSGLVLGGNARFNSRAKTVVGIIIDTADQASETIYSTTGAMKELDGSLENTDTRGVPRGFLTSASRKLDSEAGNIKRQARKNRRLIDKGLQIAYAVTTAAISLNLVAVIALSVFGVLRFQRTLHLLIALCWILTFLCWVLFGVYFFLENFANDTCKALENFQEDPSNSTLGAILPCDELQSAESVLSDFGAGVYDIVNQVNANLSVLQKTMYPNIPTICNPFSGPPDYQYRTELCPENTVRIGDIPKILKVYTCSNGNCENGAFITMSNDVLNSVESYTSSIQNLLNVYPELESLVECQSVKNAFSEILNNHCKPLKRYVHMVWASLVFLSVIMVLLVILWAGLAHHHKQLPHSLDGSVKPEDHSATAANFSEFDKSKVADDHPNISSV
ncbi:hypothetical protein CUMW_214000 [Citrus unshiu]|uniref:Transmembrane protein n=1 Tax=Citrus unshiu TaxID=55188 RepID=A0A2H5QBJ5_CITUN|nr:hypothetical protein CUMW_214000 [Citrus unshiu]